jgi:tetratricopeptide (TPR) repeat protein
LAELHLRVAAQKVREGTEDGLAQAHTHLASAWELAPDDARFPYYLAHLEMQQGNVAEATEMFEAAVAMDSDNSRYRYQLALCRVALGELEKAETELEELIASHGRVDTWLEQAAWALAVLYTKQKRWSEAADLFLSRTASLEPRSRDHAQNHTRNREDSHRDAYQK